jgi:hypothetical protein
MSVECMLETVMGGVDVVIPDLASIVSTTVLVVKIALIAVSALALALIVASLAGRRRSKEFIGERRGVYRRM